MKQNLYLLTMGLALFSMFFEAGNLIYSLQLGANPENHSLTAAFGFSITAILVPILGFFTMMLFQGDYRAFFAKCGKYTGFIMICLILLLIEPFGAIPRCIALCYAATATVFPGLNPLFFSFAAALVVFAFTVKESRIITLLGSYLTP